MNTKFFFQAIPVSILLFTAGCTKNSIREEIQPDRQDLTVSAQSRHNECDVYYAVTEYFAPNNASELLRFNDPNQPPTKIILPAGLTNLKGVSIIQGLLEADVPPPPAQPVFYEVVYVTTGNRNGDPQYDNSLIKLRIDGLYQPPLPIPVASVLYSARTVDNANNPVIVSDICFVDYSNTPAHMSPTGKQINHGFNGILGFVGLLNNSNTIAVIPLTFNPSFSINPVELYPIQGVPAGQTARGLSWVGADCDQTNNYDIYVNTVATTTGPDKLLLIDRDNGQVISVTDVDPAPELGRTGALGWLYCGDELFFGRNSSVSYGYNTLQHAGAQLSNCPAKEFASLINKNSIGFAIEDFTTIPY